MDENSKKTALRETLQSLRTPGELYVIMSGATKLPFVVCNPETFDDEILLYYTEAEAKEEAMKLQKEGNPMQLVKVDENSRLSFFTGLFPMGVNCILVDKGLDGQITVQLDELITRPKDEELPEGKIRVENPELVLTAAYFMQQMRKPDKPEMTDELKELNEEMLAHYQEGRYIVTVQEDKGIPILKQKDGKPFGGYAERFFAHKITRLPYWQAGDFVCLHLFLRGAFPARFF